MFIDIYTHTMKYYSSLKKEKILPYPTMWINLENIILILVIYHYYYIS